MSASKDDVHKNSFANFTSSIEVEPVECKLTKVGDEYFGIMNAGASFEFGSMKCQPWLGRTSSEGVSMQNLGAFPDPGVDGGHNYCRNPNRDPDGPWCYTGEATGKGLQYCQFPLCFEAYERAAIDGDPAVGEPECLQTEMGKEYVGTVRKTKTGKSCLSWSSMNSSLEVFRDVLGFDKKIAYDDHFRFGKAALHQHFCRNPTLKERPWCFVSPLGEWDYCEISSCPSYPNKTECRWTKEGEEYAGTRNMTSSMRPCLSWSVSKLYERYWPRFPEDVGKIDHNFCRNPNGTTTAHLIGLTLAASGGHRHVFYLTNSKEEASSKLTDLTPHS
ncbi:unnamed protein product [Darwinula stevensoni]|uniref:Kringle domain-containing protein n=1 Tax=Darwinula stevensoni TaxID=69355 RepID=A0A7R9A4E9_9CRUS|nr:unnamed protein product [Darwinula stevensoni]CAG0883223.1 unnamed protein product [Darwinula stevensoni]